LFLNTRCFDGGGSDQSFGGKMKGATWSHVPVVWYILQTCCN
jgi:hypothetical protein